MKENKVVTISAQIPAELEKTRIELCELEERSKSFCVRKALEKYLEEKAMNDAVNKKKKSKKQ